MVFRDLEFFEMTGDRQSNYHTEICWFFCSHSRLLASNACGRIILVSDPSYTGKFTNWADFLIKYSVHEHCFFKN